MASAVEKDLDEDTYIGLELPLNIGKNGIFNRTNNSLAQAAYNIKNLLLTNTGERLGNPTFGSNLPAILFEPMEAGIEDRVEEAIRSAMSRWLPFIIVENIISTFPTTDVKTINVSIEFSLVTDVFNKNLVLLELK